MAELPENDRIAGPFIATAGQTDFPADFPLIDAGALRFRRERNGVVTVLSGDAVSAIGESPDGFTCRLADGSDDGDRCFVYSSIAPARLRQHTPNGAVRSATLEGDAVSLQAQVQEAQRDLVRTIAAPPGEAGIELAPAAAREGRLPVFADGGIGVLDTPERLIATDGEGKAYALPLVNVLQEIGVDFIDDGQWSPNGGLLTHDDGVFG